MRKCTLIAPIALAFLSIALAGPLLAADTATTPIENAKNADTYSLLGYSNGWMGKYDEAFAAYKP